MDTINFGFIVYVASSIVSQAIISRPTKTTEGTVQNHLNCPRGKIFLYSANYSQISGDRRLPDSELKKLYRKCSHVKKCNFKTELNNESIISYACEEENLHFISDVIEDGLKRETNKSLFYYNGREYKSTGRELLCVIKPKDKMNQYINWIHIQETSRTVLEIVVFGKSMTFSAGSSIYRNNTKVNSSVTLKLRPDPSQNDQLSLGFTSLGGTLDVNCSIIEIPGSPGTNTTIIIIACVVCVAIIAIIIGVVCIIYRKRKKCMARRAERCVQLTKSVSKGNNYSDIPMQNNKQREQKNYDYVTSGDATNPQNIFNTTSSDDVPNTRVSGDGKKIINLKQLESRVMSSGYSEPIDSVKPIKISTKVSDYAEPCNEKECFTSKCLQNKAMLQNYDNFHVVNSPKSGENTYSHVGGNQSEDDYDHFDRVKGNNSRIPDENYSHIPEAGLKEDDYNTTSNVLSKETTSNPNYDHIN